MVLVSTVKLPNEVEPLALAAGNLIEVFFHFRRESDVYQVPEMGAKEACDRKSRKAWDERFALAEHVPAPFDRPDGGRIRRWPTDAQTLELLDQRCFRVSRRRRRFVPFR